MKGPVLFLSVFLLSSCESGFYDKVSENIVDPSISQPTAEAFISLAGVPVTWAKDDNADGYILYRRIAGQDITQQIYQGTNLTFTDTSALPDTIYAYTLAKYRGNKTFTAGTLSYGAFDPQYVKDLNGLCNAQSLAAAVTTQTVYGHIFYYSVNDISQQATLDDSDWYYVDLGPMLEDYFVFYYGAVNQAGDLDITTTSNLQVVNQTEFAVINPETTTQRLYFCVKSDPGALTGFEQVRVDYSFVFKSTSPYVPSN